MTIERVVAVPGSGLAFGGAAVFVRDFDPMPNVLMEWRHRLQRGGES